MIERPKTLYYLLPLILLFVLFLNKLFSLSMSDSVSSLELSSDLLSTKSQFLSLLIYIYILLKVFADNTFYLL